MRYKLSCFIWYATHSNFSVAHSGFFFFLFTMCHTHWNSIAHVSFYLQTIFQCVFRLTHITVSYIKWQKFCKRLLIWAWEKCEYENYTKKSEVKESNRLSLQKNFIPTKSRFNDRKQFKIVELFFSFILALFVCHPALKDRKRFNLNIQALWKWQLPFNFKWFIQFLFYSQETDKMWNDFFNISIHSMN